VVTPHTPESLAHGAMTPLERELARASRGPDALDETHDTADAHAAPAADRAAQRTSSAPDARRAPHNPHLAHWREHLHALSARSQRALPLRPCGRLTRAAGLVLEAIGLRLSVGAECTIELPPGSTLPYAEAEVVGFSGERLFLMPTTDVAGVLPGARVWPLERAPVADPLAGAKRLPVGWEMLGRVVDAAGKALSNSPPVRLAAASAWDCSRARASASRCCSARWRATRAPR